MRRTTEPPGSLGLEEKPQRWLGVELFPGAQEFMDYRPRRVPAAGEEAI